MRIWVFKLLFLENSVMFLECFKNNSKILSDVIIMQFGKGELTTPVDSLNFIKHKQGRRF